MKVLHVGKFYPPHRGGIETHLETLCRGIRDSVDVEVLVSSDDAREAVEVRDGVRIRRLPTWFTFASAPIGPGLASAIRSSSADIVHLHYPHPTAVLAWLASGHRGHLVITYHSDVVRQKVLGKAFEPFLRAALRCSSAIIATSPNYVDSSPILRDFRNRCIIVPFGIRAGDFDRVDSSAVARIRSEMGSRVVLTVGRLVGYKGLVYLVRAMRDIRARLMIVGDGPLRQELIDEAERLGVAEKISFIAQAGDLLPYYHAADVFVLPSISRAEAFGLVQLEAMACGRPVVNTSLDSGVPYVSLDGVTGFSVPPCDPGALAASIGRLLDDSDLRARFGDAARTRVTRNFSIEDMLGRTRELYFRLAAGSKLV